MMGNFVLVSFPNAISPEMHLHMTRPLRNFINLFLEMFSQSCRLNLVRGCRIENKLIRDVKINLDCVYFFVEILLTSPILDNIAMN